MDISLDNNPMRQWIFDEIDSVHYPRQEVVVFGPGVRSVGIEVRDLIHWVASNNECGDEGRIVNHRRAAILRAIAEEFYPFNDDEADWIINEWTDALDGASTEEMENAHRFVEPPAPVVDIRLLDLSEGFVVEGFLFEEHDPIYGKPFRTLDDNNADVLDFILPRRAYAKYGVRGIRVTKLSLSMWVLFEADRRKKAYQPRSIWLADVEMRLTESRAARELVNEQRWGKDYLVRSAGGREVSDDDAGKILAELDALVG